MLTLEVRAVQASRASAFAGHAFETESRMPTELCTLNAGMRIKTGVKAGQRAHRFHCGRASWLTAQCSGKESASPEGSLLTSARIRCCFVDG